ncbi:MAG: calcium-binding protein, partial [Saprospiraceae bacterium]|nr:calcium-binding protein [Saprospiraceae bacterium]
MGSDELVGGKGNDIYIVDNAGDTIVEEAGGGTDKVESSIDFALGSEVEDLVLTGAADIDGTGNDLNNRLTGNSGANRLDGAAGIDSMAGGLGDDTYVVDNARDRVIEKTNEGIDTVESPISYTLATTLENLTLTGSEDINAKGNAFDNVITGNSGNNRIDGGPGADMMAGGDGDDVYVVDNAGDVVIEGASNGIDTVESSATYVLGANIENLTLTGKAAINGTGNALANVLVGNNGANQLSGGANSDVLIGSRGNDFMFGGSGSDTFILRPGDGNDQIGDFEVGTDALSLLDGLAIKSATIEDINDDGVDDTVLSFNKGGNVALLGVTDLVTTTILNIELLLDTGGADA